ncbi:MAG: 50S ribosomal protein L18 [Deltaproteobacteria bacterium]|nr:50S ribosomal protein L18 [Deltaproteobacteria bacterium]MBW2074276.1 50S ribosomal protein L18 [Deltaproteobacteria bacterium]RLB81089.1 MAG: 50S ribosomal protein L18 [Deltaproteobacteria bacterium]
MGGLTSKKKAHLRRKKCVRKKIYGTQERPRLTVFRSARHIYAQVVVDEIGHTVASASTLDKEAREHPKFESKVEASSFVGKLVAQRAIEKGIAKVVFDRNGFSYHGRVQAVAEGARQGGLDF